MRALAAAVLFVVASVYPARGQQVHLRFAPAVEIPAPTVDGNSPSFWFNGRYRYLTSDGSPVLLEGAGPLELGAAVSPVRVDRDDHKPIWFESAWLDEEDGTLYAWYHHEPKGVCPGSDLTAPQIGAAVSYDGGQSFYDLGVVLTSGEPVDCNAKNGFFAGGNGDFSVILDRDRRHFYFLFTHYGGAVEAQGIVMARLAFADRKSPSGAVWKYHDGTWTEPGLGGRVSPVLPAMSAWQREDANSYWGPAIHWNTYLESYVVFLNHACCDPGWPQEGIYASFATDLADPKSWSEPSKVMDDFEGLGAGYYPQAIGLEPGGSDTQAGATARFFIQGKSKWEAVFVRKPDVAPPDPEPDPEPGPTEEARRSSVTRGPGTRRQ